MLIFNNMNPDEYEEYLKRSARIRDGLEKTDQWSIHDGVIMVQCIDQAMMDYVEQCTGIHLKNDIGENMKSDRSVYLDDLVTVTTYHNERRNWFIIRVNKEFIEKIAEKNIMKVGTIARNHELNVKVDDIESIISSWKHYHKEE